MKSLLITLGLILGIIAFGSILYFFNKSHSNNVGDNEIQKYINDSESIQLIIPDTPQIVLSDVKGDARMLGSASFPASSVLFCDNSHKKYFLIQFIDSKIKGGISRDYDLEFSTFINYIKSDESITATVNKTELADASYGTKQNLFPYLNFRGMVM